MLKIENMRIYSFATATGAKGNRIVGFAGAIGTLDEENNNNLS